MTKKNDGKKGFFQKLKSKLTKKTDETESPLDEHEDLHLDEDGDTGEYTIEEMGLDELGLETEEAPPEVTDGEELPELPDEEEVGEFQEMSVPDSAKEQTDEIPPPPDTPSPEGTQEINPEILAQLGVDENSKTELTGEHAWENTSEETLKEMPLPETSPKQGFKDKAVHFFTQFKDKTRGVSSQAFKKLSENAKNGKYGDKLSEFDWDAFVAKTFSPEMRPTIHRTFLIALLATTSYSIGKIAAILLRGKPTIAKPSFDSGPNVPRSLPGKEIPLITRTNLFNSSQGDQNKKPDPTNKPVANQPKVCVKADKRSNLPIELMSTIVLQDSVKSLASVQVRGQKEIRDVREGEKLDQLAVVGKIDRLKLVLKNLRTGMCEFVESDAIKKAQDHGLNIMSPTAGRKKMQSVKDDRISVEGNKLSIKKNLRDEMLEDIGNVLTQARAIQINNPDGSISFKITEIVPGSIYSKLNIQDDDIITGINGKKITELNEIMNLFGQIKDIDNLSLSVLRNGAEQEMEYSFE